MPEVQYTLSLKDNLTNKLGEANSGAKKLEGTMGSLGERITHVAEAFGISFSLWKGIEFIKDSTDEYEKLILAQAQVKAGLDSTGYAAGLSAKDLEESAEKIRQQVDFTKDQIVDMQAQLLTFPQITKANFDKASMAVLDMSARTHHGVDELSIMLGKAMQDPVKGMAALHRVGVNFNEDQIKLAKHLVETGQQAKVQSLILNELSSEYGGSAKAAFDANPLAKWNLAVEDVKEGLGKIVTQILKYVTPALVGLIHGIKETIHWMQEHKTIMEIVGTVIASITALYIAQQIPILAIAAASKVATAAQWLWNLAMDANPIGIIILGLAAATAAVIYMYNHVAKFRAVLWATWAVIKEFGSIVGDIFKSLWHVIHGTFTLNPSEIKDGFAQGVDAIKDAAFRLGMAAKEGYDAGMADFAKDNAKETHVASPKNIAKGKAKGNELATPSTKETKGAKGNKAVTINIKIDALQKGDIKIMTTNIKESAGKIQELMTAALMSAVDNSQIISEK